MKPSPLTKPVSVGVIGCGSISNAYFTTCRKFANLDVRACADLDLPRAKAKAVEHSLAHACTVDELLADPAIEIVINLTIPQAHAEVDHHIISAGKHVYSEKPFALTRADGAKVVAAAEQRGVRVGCAPDTMLGANVQEARRLVDSGAIGQAVAVNAFMMMGGHESWHPAPEFYYKIGGGPLFDMGPYYLHALITILGPATRVAGSTRTTHARRTITSAPERGQRIDVEVPTHLACLIDFASGAACSLTTSFDIRTAYTAPHIEILGTEGSIAIPGDPAKPVRLSKPEDQGAWRDVPVTRPYTVDARGLGVADLGMAIRSGRRHRAHADLAMHTLDIMQAVHESSADGRYVTLTSTCERPAPIPKDQVEFVLDP